MRKPFLLGCFLAALCATAGSAATLTLTSSTLFGTPGDTVSWGFTFESTPIDDGGVPIVPWLMVSFANFVPDPGVDPVGVFTAIITDPAYIGTVIGPDAGNGEVNPWTGTFGSYAINDFQSSGDAVTGTLVLRYDVYRTSPIDPSFNPDFDTVAVGETLRLAAAVDVVPEPASAYLLVLALVFLWRVHAVRKTAC